jgi:hypothetical protein
VGKETQRAAEAEPGAEAAEGLGGAPRRRRWRLYGMRALVTTGTLLLIVGALAVWIERIVLDPSAWSDTSSKVLADETVQQTLSTYLVDEIYANVDVAGQIRAVLPPRAKPFAAPAAAGLHDSAERLTQRVLARPRVQEAWRVANRAADHELIRVIDDDGRALRTNGGAVTLDLRPIVQQVVGRIGLADRVKGKLPPNAGQIVLLRSDQLAAAQTAVRILRAIANLLAIVVLLIFAAAVWVAPERRRAIRACAIGLIVAGLALIFVRRVVGNQLVDRLVADSSVRPAAHSVWWIATDPLHLAIESILFVGLIGLIGVWIAGAGARATALRGWLAPYLREPMLAFGALAAVILALLAWSPTPAARNWFTVTSLTALAAGGIEVLRRQAAREFPLAERRPLSAASLRRPTTTATAAARDDRLQQLTRLGELRAGGVLDEAEFAREKERVLGGSAS